MDPGGQTATAIVTTESAIGVSSAGATLQGSFSGATGTIRDRGFVYGIDPDNLDQDVGLNSTTDHRGSFSVTIGSLSPNTTYYYKAFVAEYNASTGNVDYRYGELRSFKTTSGSTSIDRKYLDNYEVPAITVTSMSSGDETWGDTQYYAYGTANSNRTVITHTFSSDGHEECNYTILYDTQKHCPIWTAHVMNTSIWGDMGYSRSDDWGYDPARSDGVQNTGLDNASQVGYSRGHFVASNYRKTTDEQNHQTFYYTNQAPQWQNGFNSGVWSTLEGKVKNAAPSGSNKMLYVVTGVLFEDVVGIPKTLPSGNMTGSIPSHFYMCLMMCTLNSSGTITGALGIAYVYTNKSHTGESYYADDYVTTIDEIERRAGFDFFPNVPISLQTQAEGTPTPLWTY